ncbi:MAG: seg [Parcubacteria group bacterium]|nr:seg [Parcubacteria group bacterium]
MITPLYQVRRVPAQGFTLVETLVAIAILMIAIVAPFYSIQQAITTSYITRDQLIATSLAQEGAEYIYFLRDNNFLATPVQQPWLTGMDNCRTDSPYNHTYGCTVDPSASSNQLVACSSGGCSTMNVNGNGIYTQASGLATRFTRTVKITPNPSQPQQVTVTSQVSWTTNHQPYTTIVTENLYNWL